MKNAKKNTKTLQALAVEAHKHFELSERKNAEKTKYWKTKDGAPEWVKEMCHEAHRTGSGTWDVMLPDDFRYEFIEDALDKLANHEDADEAMDALEPDVYNHDRHKWLSSNLTRAGYVDEAVEEMDGHSDQGVDGDLGLGQLWERREVFGIVRKALEERLDEDEDE